MTLDNIKQEINKANSIILLTHENPDGDAIGSSLAFHLALKEYGKESDVVIPDYPKTYSFLPGAEEIKTEGRQETYDLAIALDCADIKRLNGFASYFENAKTRIMIDHHSKNTMFGDVNYVNPVAPACSQILITVLGYMGIEINKEIGTCILAGIITDTGGFKYSSVTAETFEFVSELLGKGINVSNIYRRVLEIKTRPNFELTKIAMNRLEFIENGRITFTYITKEDLEKVEAQTGDYEGIVEMGRGIEGVEVSVFLREEDNGFKASLRSNDYVNVADVCLMFGGGGHIKAAGCNLQGNVEQVKTKIVNEIKKYLK